MIIVYLVYNLYIIYSVYNNIYLYNENRLCSIYYNVYATMTLGTQMHA